MFSAIALFLAYLAIAAASKESPPETAFVGALLAVFLGGALTVLWWYLYVVLKMRNAATKREASENYRRVVELANEQNWRVGDDNLNASIRMHATPEWYEPCWGEMISVYFEDKNVVFSSICDPTVPKPSLTSWGRNEDHLEKLKKSLEIA